MSVREHWIFKILVPTRPHNIWVFGLIRSDLMLSSCDIRDTKYDSSCSFSGSPFNPFRHLEENWKLHKDVPTLGVLLTKERADWPLLFLYSKKG